MGGRNNINNIYTSSGGVDSFHIVHNGGQFVQEGSFRGI